MKYLMAHDLGTSGNKATLYDCDGVLIGSCVESYVVSYPKDTWAEVNPIDLWRAVCNSTKQLLEKTGIKAEDIAAVSFSGQMMGCLVVDQDGVPLRPMMIWADTRSVKQEQFMKDAIGEKRGYQITGHRLSASYSAAKLLWIKENEPQIYDRAYRMLQAKDYIIYRLTGQFVTDLSDASGTNLLDIEKQTWSTELIQAFQIRAELLPELHSSSDIAGTVTKQAAKETGLIEGMPVVIGGGDGSCACVGAGVVRKGQIYNVLGSSSWISMASDHPFYDDQMRTFNWIHLDPKLYTPCGTMQTAGMSYAWYRDAFCQLERKIAHEEQKDFYMLLEQGISSSPPGANGLLYLPYLLGERSPRWNVDARAAFIGIGISTSKEDMLRSVLEGVGYNLRVILELLEQIQPVKTITMIGGGVKSMVWRQILSDIYGKKLEFPQYLEEATSMGAAICAGVGIGIFADYSVAEKWNMVQSYQIPKQQNVQLYEELYRVFNKSYESLKDVFGELGTFRRNNTNNQ